MKALLLSIGLTIISPVFAAQDLYNVLSQDSNVVTDVRSEDKDVWIKLAAKNLSDEITVRISNKNKDFYRPWFNKDVDLVSKGFRGDQVWSDRVQTEASYIEYWHNNVLVLHLERK
jgi:hypothetical protein